MRSNNPWLSPIGLVMTAVTLFGVLLAVWMQGLTIFSPGEISAVATGTNRQSEFLSHADFESDCQACHRPLETIQADLCVDCHQNSSDQLAEAGGTHGQLEEWRPPVRPAIRIIMDGTSICFPSGSNALTIPGRNST